jgi:uracil-DNA glycosylase
MTDDLLRQYLAFYRDLGVKTIYRRERAVAASAANAEAEAVAADFSAQGSSQIVDGRPFDPSAPGFDTPSASSTDSSTPVSITPDSMKIPKDIKLPPLAPEDDNLEKISQDIGECRRCRLHSGRQNIVFGVGDPQAKIVFVGEGPGADEDDQGIPFIGRAGQLLTQMIENTASKEGIPLKREDVYICNVVKCRPPENRTPEPDEMEICGQFLYRQLSAIKPKAICLLGNTAMRALLSRDGVTRLRGQWFKWRDIPVMVTYHPSYLLRPYNQNAKREAWEDLKKLFHFVYD